MLKPVGFAEGKDFRRRLESMRERIIVIAFPCVPWCWTSEGEVAERDAFEMPQLPVLHDRGFSNAMARMVLLAC